MPKAFTHDFDVFSGGYQRSCVQNLKDFDMCASCKATAGQVSHPLDLLVPISLALEREQLHHMLRGYKDPEMLRLTASQARQFETSLVASFARFWNGHEHCVENCAQDPSELSRSGLSPAATRRLAAVSVPSP